VILLCFREAELTAFTVSRCENAVTCRFAGGLDDALNNIIEMSRQQDVPFVFALGRRALGRVCAKLVPVSIVGVFCYEGTEVCQVSSLLLLCIVLN